MLCPNCSYDSPAEMRYCGMCGTHLAIACKECGFINPLFFHFCGTCGTKLALDLQTSSMAENGSTAPVGADNNTNTTPLPHPLEGERKVITVIVTDLTDSTQLLEKMGTEVWVGLMNVLLHILEIEINRFGGEISQFRGDGLVAMFGASSAHEDDADRAVLAALSMQQAFQQHVHGLTQPEAIDLKMRVGVNTGEVIVSNPNDRQHWEETAMGIAVSVAARLEVAAEPGTILVSENTHALVESQIEWQSLGEISVKGVSQPIAVFKPLVLVTNPEEFPLGESSLLSIGQVTSNSIPLIGREAELQSLIDCVTGLFDGRGHIATIQGDRGSGKSFLLSEVQDYFIHRAELLAESRANIMESPPLTWLRGRCRSYSQTWPYSVWLDLFSDWLKLQPDDTKIEKLAKLKRQVEEIGNNILNEHYPYIATFLGLPLEENLSDKIRYLDGEGLRQRVFLAIRSWIEAFSQKGPMVLTFRNLQWADDSSLALLRYCLPVCDHEALLWALAFRPERENTIWEFNQYLEIEYPHRLSKITLLPLTDEQSLELIQHIIGPDTLPIETSKLVIHNAGGNPYYILELVRVLISRSVLAWDADKLQWHVTRSVTTLDLPESLQQLLVSQLDRLNPQEHQVFQAASVIGPVFWFNMLQSLLGEIPTLKTALAALQRAQFIEENGRVQDLGMQYSIRSPLLRDTAYESLLSSQRAAYHLKAAEYLESLTAPDILGGYDGMLSYHYRGAGNLKKELFYALLAADQARKIYANTEALQHYARAIDLLNILQSTSQSEDETHLLLTEKFELFNDRRQVFHQLGQIEASQIDTQALLQLAYQMQDDPIWLIDALLAQADILKDSIEDIRQGISLAWQALSLSQNIGDRQREMRCLICLANYHLSLKDSNWHNLAERALELARQLGELKAEVNLLIRIGSAYGIDDLPRNREYLQAALSKSESLNDKATELSLLREIAEQVERDGDYYRQLTDYGYKRLAICRQIGNRLREGTVLMNCGQIQGLYLGDYIIGLELENQALQILENQNARLFPLLRIAQMQAELGQYDQALLTLDMAYPLGEKVVADIGRAGLKLVSAIVFNAMGDEPHLYSALNLSLEIQQMAADNLVSRQYQMTAASVASAAHLKLAKICGKRNADEKQDHIRQALEQSQTSLNIFEQFGFVQVVECTTEEIFLRHSQALSLNKQNKAAAEFLQKAHAEMIRKFNLIPVDSPFRKTYLENIALHRKILTTYKPRTQA